MWSDNLKGLTLSTCADDTHIIYFDGKQVNNNPKENEYNQVIITPIPSETKVIAVSITNLVDEAGFRAAFSDNSVVSDGSWKCSSTFAYDWQNVDFDDSLWPAAATTGIISGCKDFPPSAKYLWTDQQYKSVNTIYCRKTLGRICMSHQLDILYAHAVSIIMQH